MRTVNRRQYFCSYRIKRLVVNAGLVAFSFLALNPPLARAAEWEMMDKFVVNGASMFKSSVAVIVPEAQSASIWASTSAVTPHLFVSTGGNVGIGTASPDNPGTVIGTVPGSKLVIYSNLTSEVLLNMRTDGTRYGWLFQSAGADHGRVAMSAFNGTSRNIYLDPEPGTASYINAGNVGISTRAPQARLDVLAGGKTATDMVQIWRNSDGVIQGSMSATGVMMAKKFIGDGSSLTGLSGDNLGNHTATAALNMAGFNAVRVGSITFSTDNNVAISSASTLSNGGLYISTHVVARGVGQFIGGSYNLGSGAVSDVAIVIGAGKSIYFDATSGYLRNLIGANGGDIAVGQTGTANISSINLRAGNSGYISMVPGSGEAVRVTSTGNVGIGTTSPTAKLTVVGQSVYPNETTPSIKFMNDATANNKIIQLGYDDTMDAGYIYTYQSATGLKPLVLMGGNVGISTGAPQAKLDVQGGDIRASGWLRAGNATATSGSGTSGYGISLPSTSNDQVYIMGEHNGADTSDGIFFTGDNITDGWVFRNTDWSLGTTDYLRISRFRTYFVEGSSVSIGVVAPNASLDVKAGGSTATGMAQIWRNSGGTIQSSMSATGVMMAKYFIGNGSMLTNLTGDNLGNHTATTNLNMSSKEIISVATITVNGLGRAAAWATTASGISGIPNSGAVGYMQLVNSAANSWKGNLFSYDVYWDGANWRIPGDSANTMASAITTALGGLQFYTRATSGASPVTLTPAQFDDLERMRIDTTGKVGIGTTSPVTKLHVNAEVSDDNGYSYDANSLMVVHPTPTSTTALNDPQTVLMLARQGTSGQAYGAAAAFGLSRYEASGVNSRTRLDISLAHDSFTPTSNTVMTIRSDGKVGIGSAATAPRSALDVRGQGVFTVNSAISSAPLVTSALEANLSAHSLITLGETGSGNANPAITLYRTGAGQRTGAATRLSMPASPGGALYIQNGSASSGYGSETYSTRMTILFNGDVGITTMTPQARLDVMDDGKTATDMVQIWRNSDGTIVSSMSATGVMKAVKFIGDGSGLTGVAPFGTAGGVLSGTYPNPGFANNTSYPVSSVEGSGIKFWSGDDNYKIHFGQAAEYKYGPVTDYSIKTNMSNNAGRGWTWGVNGVAPIAALSNTGKFQTAGNVGVAGASPDYPLAVNGVIAGQYSTGTGDVLRIGNDTKLVDIDVANTAGLYSIGTPTIGSLKLGSGGGTISGYSGNIGIGNTSPNALLTVGTGASYTGEGHLASFWSGNDTSVSILSNANVSGQGPRLRLFENNTAKYGTELFYDSGNNDFSITNYANNSVTGRMRMDASGRVIIGTVTPTAMLSIYTPAGTTTSSFDLRANGAHTWYTGTRLDTRAGGGVMTWAEGYWDATTLWTREGASGTRKMAEIYGVDGSGANIKIYDGANATQVLLNAGGDSYLNAGKVGIGTASPRSALDTHTGVMTGAANDYEKAQFAMTGGGTISWAGPGGKLKWTSRFIAIPAQRPTTFSAGYVDIVQPVADIPAGQVYSGVARTADANGVILNSWEALYAAHTVGGNNSAITYYIVHYQTNFNPPSNWLLVAAINGDDSTAKLGNGVILKSGGSWSAGSYSPTGSDLADHYIWVGNSSNKAAAVAMSGDATLGNTGALTLASVGSAGTYATVTTDAKGRVTSGSNTSASLASALTDETGTAGYVVFSNAPTLTGNITVNSNTLGVILNGADRPLITRGFDLFTSGNYTGIGRWGLFMEPSALTIGIPNTSQSFRVASYNADSTKNDLVTVIGNTGRMGIGTTAPGYKLDVTGDIRASGALIEKLTTFTPTAVGWYRIVSGGTTTGGTVRLSASYDNSLTDVELQYNIGGYGVNGSIQQTRYSSYNGGAISQARISSDGGNNVYLDIYVSRATTPGPVSVYAYGPMQASLVASPVVGAAVGSTNVHVLTLGHGFRSTQGANLAETSGNVGIGTASPGYKLDVQGGDINASGNLREAGTALSGKYAYVGGSNASGTWPINITGTSAGAPPTGAAGGMLSGTYPNPGLATNISVSGSMTAGGGANGLVAMRTGTATNIGYIEFKTPAGVRQGYIGYGASNLGINLENSASLVIGGGNVGIGTASPGYKLDVNGNIGTNYGSLILNPNGGTVGTDGTYGVYWHQNAGTPNATYGIYRTAGAWSAPNYAQLKLSFDTGIVMDPGTGNGKSYVDIQGGGLRVTSGSVGIGNTSPGYKLDVTGRIRATTGFHVATKDDAGAMASGSGFFETSAPTNYYSGASNWQHLIESRHSNDGNNYALQIAGSFFDQELYFRKTNASPTTAWSKIIHQNSTLAGDVTGTPGATVVGDDSHNHSNTTITSLDAGKINSGTLPVGRGGTGATTLTGIVRGNGTSAFTASALTDADVPNNITIDYAAVAGNADTTDSLHAHTGTNNEANKLVRTDGNGYIQAGWINTTSGDNGTKPISRVYASGDGDIRYYSLANFAAQISTQQVSCSGMTMIGTGRGAYCIDSSRRGGQNFYNANMTCINAGYHLCSFAEYYTACVNQSWSDGSSWTGEAGYDGNIGTVGLTLSCSAGDTGASAVSSSLGFRCCVK